MKERLQATDSLLIWRAADIVSEFSGNRTARNHSGGRYSDAQRSKLGFEAGCSRSRYGMHGPLGVSRLPGSGHLQVC